MSGEYPTMSRFCVVLMIAGLISITGCGGSGDTLQPSDMKLVPVNGRVMVGKQPLVGATLKFKPKFEWKSDVPVPHATTGADGSFELETFLAGDGAPTGDYLVGISLPGPAGESGSSNGGPYEDPDKSGLKATVKTTATKLPDFVIKASGLRSQTGSNKSRK